MEFVGWWGGGGGGRLGWVGILDLNRDIGGVFFSGEGKLGNEKGGRDGDGCLDFGGG